MRIVEICCDPTQVEVQMAKAWYVSVCPASATMESTWCSVLKSQKTSTTQQAQKRECFQVEGSCEKLPLSDSHLGVSACRRVLLSGKTHEQRQGEATPWCGFCADAALLT